MRVGILDNEKLWCSKAEKIIVQYGKKCEINMEMFCFTSEEELDAYKGEPLDVLFLDIELKEGNHHSENGIELARKINSKWSKCQIVYLTNYLCYATDVYKTEHIYFILKEQFETRIGEVFEKVMHNLMQRDKKIIFEKIGGGMITLAPEEILYFERNGRTTWIVTTFGKYEIWDKLSEVFDRLPKLDFVRCHNSYIVYFPAVRELEKDHFSLNDGTRIVISRRHAKEVKNAFMKWALTQMS